MSGVASNTLLSRNPLIEANDVSMRYQSGGPFSIGRRRTVRAVSGVSLSIRSNEAVGVVGESGSGKSTLGRMILGLERPTEGQVLYKERPLEGLRGNDWKAYRSSVQSVFQDPGSSLDPRRRVRASIEEPLKVLTSISSDDRGDRVSELLGLVGLASWVGDAYPHELSGGMRQRVSVARAIAPWPECIVLDEPVSALDVSIKAQVMNLLKDLQETLQVAYMLIAHDLATVRFLADRTLVMYSGRMVESTTSEKLFSNPVHPYTIQLLAASVPTRYRGRSIEEKAASQFSESASDRVQSMPCPLCGLMVSECLAGNVGLVEVEPGHHVACGTREDDNRQNDAGTSLRDERER